MSQPVQHDVELPGCTPEPLMSYLKALGILRLVSEQKDAAARGWWKNDTFWLRSFLDRNALMKFFLEEYQPTPIVAPWAGGSGFFPKDNTHAVNALGNSNSQRCEAYAEVIAHVRQIIKDEEIGDKPKDEDKTRLICRYRRELPDEVIAWMDAAMVLRQDGQRFAPLLGTGGNDGRLDFTQNFMQRIVLLGLHKENEQPSDESRKWLVQALFALPAQLASASVGQFAPGRAGGPNATQGMEGNAVDNPWDFILMLEGTLILAGAAVRRFNVADTPRATFPFTVRTVAAGFNSLASTDESDSRGELWLPLWNKPTSNAELCQLFGEGRAEVCGQVVQNSVDFARAVAGLGVDRGITRFQRVGFLKRRVKACLAASLGWFDVAERASVDLLREADFWLDRFRRAAQDKNTPPRFAAAIRAIDSAIFDFCKYGGNSFFQRILVALGRAERELALTSGKIGQGNSNLPPLGGLSTKWIEAARDSSSEFSLALALAAVQDPEMKIGPLRANLEPVDWEKRRPAWAEKGRCVVWNAADLATNLANVLQRRLMDGRRVGCEYLPLSSPFTASLDTVAAFLAGEMDDQRIEELIWGLLLVSNVPKSRDTDGNESTTPLPREYALLKLLFLPAPLIAEQTGDRVRWRLARPLDDGSMEVGIGIRPEPRILPLLRAGRVGDACRIAVQRLRVSGLVPMPGALPSGIPRDYTWAHAVANPRFAQRLAAALLIPISSKSVNYLIYLVCRPDESAVAETLTLSTQGESE